MGVTGFLCGSAAEDLFAAFEPEIPLRLGEGGGPAGGRGTNLPPVGGEIVLEGRVAVPEGRLLEGETIFGRFDGGEMTRGELT